MAQVGGRSFGSVAELYDRVRPRYPAAALRWMLGEEPCLVADVGAGTGILTRQLLTLGHRVVAVEPDPGMWAKITNQVQTIGAVAEHLPLADASVDAVVAGQSYHWFEPDRAHPEIARVVRPGGVFAPIWNWRNEDEPWIGELSARLDDEAGMRPFEYAPPAGYSFGPGFGPVERGLFAHETVHTPDSLLELVRSRSYYLTAERAQQERIDATVRDLLATHPDLVGRASFEMSYVTFAFRARREPG
jgi:SAM-dependent methyltransferase